MRKRRANQSNRSIFFPLLKIDIIFMSSPNVEFEARCRTQGETTIHLFKATCSSSVIPFVDFLLTEFFFAATSEDY